VSDDWEHYAEECLTHDDYGTRPAMSAEDARATLAEMAGEIIARRAARAKHATINRDRREMRREFIEGQEP
jgi:hypothetical protein